MIVTCLIGDPVDHSVSNYLFDFYAKQFNLEYAHIKLRVDSRVPENLAKAVDGLRVLNFSGANITLPYKTAVIPFLDEIDLSAKIMGAVNTIVNTDGHLKGFNTDGYGALETIRSQLHELNADDKILILGAGGACRAVLFEVLKNTRNVTVMNRSPDRLERLTKDFNQQGLYFTPVLLSEVNLKKFLKSSTIIINTTSVGMHPDYKTSLISQDLFNTINKSKEFFDVIFNPEPTKLLQLASASGHKIVGGMRMMIYQGIRAFELWTKCKVREDMVEEVYNLLLKKLHG